MGKRKKPTKKTNNQVKQDPVKEDEILTLEELENIQGKNGLYNYVINLFPKRFIRKVIVFGGLSICFINIFENIYSVFTLERNMSNHNKQMKIQEDKLKEESRHNKESLDQMDKLKKQELELNNLMNDKNNLTSYLMNLEGLRSKEQINKEGLIIANDYNSHLYNRDRIEENFNNNQIALELDKNRLELEKFKEEQRKNHKTEQILEGINNTINNNQQEQAQQQHNQQQAEQKRQEEQKRKEEQQRQEEQKRKEDLERKEFDNWKYQVYDRYRHSVYKELEKMCLDNNLNYSKLNSDLGFKSSELDNWINKNIDYYLKQYNNDIQRVYSEGYNPVYPIEKEPFILELIRWQQ